ncbi:MAG: ABC transporter substrate-binding protein [Chloroflexi bacterium]|nr:ABC transporter substrate-binding protein [Chloroflexota bacterium]
MRSTTRYMLYSVLVLVLVLTACGPAPTEEEIELIPIRFGSIAGASQTYIPKLMQEQGIAEKYGFEVEIITLGGFGAQWTGLRSGDFDISSGSALDLLRQRKAGLEVRAIRAFITFGNPIVAFADAPYDKLSDLAGARVGTPSTALLDWMIIRAAGVRLYGFDIEKETEPVNTSPALITELLKSGEIDAAFQFSDFTLGPIAEGTLKQITSVPELIAEAGFDPDSFYLTYNLADSWREQYPEAVALLVAAMDEAVDLMMTDDSIWPELAAFSGMENEDLLPLFIEKQRNSFRTNFSRDKLEPTQELVDSLVQVVGEEPVGVTLVDPEAFDFDSVEAAKDLRR